MSPAATVKVTELLAGYQFGDRVYGPFQASKDKPYVEVPAALAAALNLPLHESEVQAREEAAAQAEDDADGVDVQAILQENHNLKADVDAVTQDRERLQEELTTLHGVIGWSSDSSVSAADMVRNIWGTAETNRTELTRATNEAAALRDRVTQLEEQLAAAGTRAADAPQEPATTGTALPADLAHADLLAAHGFTSMETLEAGLVIADGETESPVRKIDGIGGKTEEALKKLVADWRASL